mgnify:CR=1 FL=1
MGNNIKTKMIDGKTCVPTSFLAEIFGVSTKTLAAWAKDGCPKARMVAGQGGNRLADSGQPGERRPRKNEPKGAQALLGGKSQKGTNGKPRI